MRTKGFQAEYLASQGKNMSDYTEIQIQMNLENIEASIKKKWELFVEEWINPPAGTISEEMMLNEEKAVFMRSVKKENSEKIQEAINQVS